MSNKTECVCVDEVYGPYKDCFYCKGIGKVTEEEGSKLQDIPTNELRKELLLRSAVSEICTAAGHTLVISDSVGEVKRIEGPAKVLVFITGEEAVG